MMPKVPASALRGGIVVGALWFLMSCGPPSGESPGAGEKPSDSATPQPAASGADETGTAAPSDSGGAGHLAGNVFFDGPELPVMEPIAVNVDVGHCGGKVKMENRIVNAANRGLANVVVKIEGLAAAGGASDRPTVAVANRVCAFSPHVSVGMAGDTLEITNADPVNHTTHAYYLNSSFFNVTIGPGADAIRRPLRRPGLVELRCDIHKWMHGWVVVHDSPHAAVTDADGAFEIRDVPAGEYTVTAWHEDLGTRTARVRIENGKTATAEFRFKPE